MFEKKPIVEMFYGNLGNREAIDCNTKRHGRCCNELVEADDKLRELLQKDETALSLYKKAMNALEGMYSEEIDCYYASAFQFGVLIGMDVAGYFERK